MSFPCSIIIYQGGIKQITCLNIVEICLAGGIEGGCYLLQNALICPANWAGDWVFKPSPVFYHSDSSSASSIDQQTYTIPNEERSHISKINVKK